MFQQADPAPRKIVDVYLRWTDCFAAYSALLPEPPKLSFKLVNTLAYTCIAVFAVVGAWLCVRYSRQIGAELWWKTLIFALILLAISVSALVRFFPYRTRFSQLQSRWTAEQSIPQPIEVFADSEGLLISVEGVPLAYPWKYYMRTMLLRRGRLWAAVTFFNDVTYISRDNFPSNETFAEFVKWAEDCWKNRSAGHGFPVLPAAIEPQRGESL